MRVAVDSIARSVLSGANTAMAMLRGDSLCAVGRQMMHSMAPCTVAPKLVHGFAAQSLRMRSCTPVTMNPGYLLSSHGIRLVSTYSVSESGLAAEGDQRPQAVSQPVSTSATPAAALVAPAVSGVATNMQPVLGKAAARVYSSHIRGDVSLLKQLEQPPTQFASGHEILDSIVKVRMLHPAMSVYTCLW